MSKECFLVKCMIDSNICMKQTGQRFVPHVIFVDSRTMKQVGDFKNKIKTLFKTTQPITVIAYQDRIKSGHLIDGDCIDVLLLAQRVVIHYEEMTYSESFILGEISESLMVENVPLDAIARQQSGVLSLHPSSQSVSVPNRNNKSLMASSCQPTPIQENTQLMHHRQGIDPSTLQKYRNEIRGLLEKSSQEDHQHNVQENGFQNKVTISDVVSDNLSHQFHLNHQLLAEEEQNTAIEKSQHSNSSVQQETQPTPNQRRKVHTVKNPINKTLSVGAFLTNLRNDLSGMADTTPDDPNTSRKRKRVRKHKKKKVESPPQTPPISFAPPVEKKSRSQPQHLRFDQENEDIDEGSETDQNNVNGHDAAENAEPAVEDEEIVVGTGATDESFSNDVTLSWITSSHLGGPTNSSQPTFSMRHQNSIPCRTEEIVEDDGGEIETVATEETFPNDETLSRSWITSSHLGSPSPAPVKNGLTTDPPNDAISGLMSLRAHRDAYGRPIVFKNVKTEISSSSP